MFKKQNLNDFETHCVVPTVLGLLFQVSDPDDKLQLTVWIICLLLGTTCKVADAPRDLIYLLYNL